MPTDYIPIWKLREIIGEEAAQAMLAVYGGTKVRIPAAPSPGSRLTQAVGLDAAQRLSTYFVTSDGEKYRTGATIELPSGRAQNRSAEQRRLCELIEAGATDTEILSELNVVDRTIRRWRAKLGKSKKAATGPTNLRLKKLVCDPDRLPESIAAELNVPRRTVNKWRKALAPHLVTPRGLHRGKITGRLPT